MAAALENKTVGITTENASVLISGRPGRVVETESKAAESRPERDFATPLVRSRTEPERVYGQSGVTIRGSDNAPQRDLPLQEPRTGRNFVEGSVLEIEDDSVLCEVSTDAGLRQIRLPTQLMPEDVRYGMAIRISMEEKDGIRRPIVQAIVPTEEARREGMDQIRELHDAF